MCNTYIPKIPEAALLALISCALNARGDRFDAAEMEVYSLHIQIYREGQRSGSVHAYHAYFPSLSMHIV